MAIAFKRIILEKNLFSKSVLKFNFTAPMGIPRVPCTRETLHEHLLCSNIFFHHFLIVNFQMAIVFKRSLWEKSLFSKSVLKFDFTARMCIEKVPSTRETLHEHPLCSNILFHNFLPIHQRKKFLKANFLKISLKNLAYLDHNPSSLG